MSAVITQTSALAQLANGPEAAGDIVLQPGMVIDARVLAVRENLARIVIAGLAVDVLSEVALQPGAALKLAVSQTPEGNVRLAVVSPDTPGRTAPVSAPTLPAASAALAPAATALGTAVVSAPKPIGSPPLVPPGPEALAVSQAVQTAAPRQASLAPLFANLPVVVASDSVPRQVQSAATQLLATRPPLDSRLTADDLRQAFQKSGLFLESSLARGATAQGSPDLKAALVVFRQVLTNWLGQTGSTAQSPASSAQTLGQGAPPQANLSPGVSVAQGAARPPAATAQASATAVRTQVPQAGLTGVPQSAQLPPQDPSLPPVARQPAAVQGELARTALKLSTGEAVNSLRASTERAAFDPVARAAEPLQNQHTQGGRPAAETPPPFRGAAPSAQPIAAPTLVPDTPPASMGRQLLEQTDAALARQTLLQVASLPDRPDLGGTNQNNQPRWSFEIPFATPQGTAMAQFEISRDGGNEVEAASSSRVWRARFTLDVEPAGPVHALVSLVGEKTAVRLWAERPETAAQLRAGAGALGEALRQVELEPGDILVGDGAPPLPVKTRAGRFLDRAT